MQLPLRLLALPDPLADAQPHLVDGPHQVIEFVLALLGRRVPAQGQRFIEAIQVEGGGVADNARQVPVETALQQHQDDHRQRYHQQHIGQQNGQGLCFKPGMNAHQAGMHSKRADVNRPCASVHQLILAHNGAGVGAIDLDHVMDLAVELFPHLHPDDILQL